MMWEGVIEFFAIGLAIGALARKRPALIASALLAVSVLSLLVYFLSPKLWESAWSGSLARLQGAIFYFYSYQFVYLISATVGAAVAFVGLRPRKKATEPAQQKPMKVKVLP